MVNTQLKHWNWTCNMRSQLTARDSLTVNEEQRGYNNQIVFILKNKVRNESFNKQIVLTCKMGHKEVIFSDRTRRPPNHMDVRLARKLEFSGSLITSMLCSVRPHPNCSPHQQSMCGVPPTQDMFFLNSNCSPKFRIM